MPKNLYIYFIYINIEIAKKIKKFWARENINLYYYYYYYYYYYLYLYNNN